MQNKLQELTDKLYNEGLSKGRQDGEQILSKAKEEAGLILSKAREEAEKIIAEAEKEASEISQRSAGDIRMASVQAITAIKQQVENAVINTVVRIPVKNVFSDKDFLKELILKVIGAFKASEPEGKGLDVILSSSAKKELGERFEAEISSLLNSGVEVKQVKGMTGGFRIEPKESGYRIDFSDEDFINLIGEYLRPATKKILFG
ncbi:MAG: hypothetical protein KBT00_08200 [Bacteroidales bacterium]|nr:hypothetical protein [Candidatus Cacconaster merdequi]